MNWIKASTRELTLKTFYMYVQCMYVRIYGLLAIIRSLLSIWSLEAGVNSQKKKICWMILLLQPSTSSDSSEIEIPWKYYYLMDPAASFLSPLFERAS